MKHLIVAISFVAALGPAQWVASAQDAEVSEADIEAAAELAVEIQAAIDGLPDGASEDETIAAIFAVLDASEADDATKLRALAAIEEVALQANDSEMAEIIRVVIATFLDGTGGNPRTTPGGFPGANARGNGPPFSAPPAGPFSGGSDY